MKFFIKTYGCQYNEWDAERIRYTLNKLGGVEVSEKEADLFLIIACSVRKSAVDRVFSMIKNWKGNKIIIAGCVLDSDRKKVEQKNVYIWNINDPDSLLQILSIAENKPVKLLLDEGSLKSSYLPIMTGCNNFCSYCVVPYTRGREISRPLEEILSDFKKLLRQGKKEIILLGQNVNSYKNMSKVKSQKSKFRNDFAVLLETLNNIPGNFKIKFTSNHPKDMNDEIIKAVRDLPKIKKEIHLPLQSGSNKILRAMNRPYTKEQYLKIVDKIKKEIPGVKISTDTIIGFPGETEEDFQETVEVLRSVNYFQSFNNKYSPRVGTKAFDLGDPIPWKEKERRWRILNEITNKK